MEETSEWAFPEAMQPDADALRFDLSQALEAAVLLRAEIPEDAFTAPILGTERSGNGIVIRADGLILTIGYLVTEARTLWITSNDGRVVEGYPLAYDFATGFGLVQPLGALAVPPLPLGSARGVQPEDPVIVVGHGGRDHALQAKVLARREFAGYWEYLLDDAIYTLPAHPQWGGSGLLNRDGELIGIGSLLVQEENEHGKAQGNMFVPIDLLPPILDDLTRFGRSTRPVRPWLGMYTTESDNQLVVAGLANGGPAQRDGVHQGDMVIDVAGERVTTLSAMLRRIWSLGSAGVPVPLTLAREGGLVRLTVRSADRADYLKKPLLH